MVRDRGIRLKVLSLGATTNPCERALSLVQEYLMHRPEEVAESIQEGGINMGPLICRALGGVNEESISQWFRICGFL